MNFYPLETYIEDIEKCYHFAIDGAFSQHKFYPEFSLGECLRNRSYFMTIFGKDHPIFEKACQLIEQVKEKSEMDVFMPEAHEIMINLFKAREKEVPPAVPHSFRYALNDKGQCYIHIGNARQPKSFLDTTKETIDDFRYVMDLAEKEKGCSEIFTATWLNSCDRFLRYFPQEWMDNMIIPPDKELYPTGGVQGQFINKTGLLNDKVANYYITTGKVMFKRSISYCSFKAMRAHLDKMEREL